MLILSCPDSQQANEKEGALFLVDVKEVYAIKQDLNHSNSLEHWLKHNVGKKNEGIDIVISVRIFFNRYFQEIKSKEISSRA